MEQEGLDLIMNPIFTLTVTLQEKSEEVDPERIRELAVALFLLTRKQSLTFDSVVRVAYHIFDEDGDGEMDKEEVILSPLLLPQLLLL